MKKRPVRRLYILILIVLSILAVVVGFKYILPLFLPFVFGYFLAWLAAPIVNFLKVRFRIPRGVASFVVVLTFLIVGILITYLVIRTVLYQIQGVVTNLPYYQNLFIMRMEGICNSCDKIFGLGDGTSYFFIKEKMDDLTTLVQGNILSKGTGEAINVAKIFFEVIWKIVIVFISALLLVKEFPDYKEEFQNSCFYKEIHMVTEVLSDTGVAYLKAQFILMCITMVICVIGVFLTGNSYAILIGAGIALFDAFPVLGSAFLLVPWAIVLFLKKRIAAAIILLVTLAICTLVRQLLEPKLVGNCIGVRPVYTLISMYVGLKIYGGFGFVLGPVSLIAMRAIVNAGVRKLRGSEES